jgi:hypothetical protein
MPQNYEDRMRRVKIPHTTMLNVFVPDKYDLSLSKTLRGNFHDVEAIEGIHAHHPLVLKTLLDRFETEVMRYLNSDPRDIQQNMIMVVAALFGMAEARKLALLWGFPTPTGKLKPWRAS